MKRKPNILLITTDTQRCDTLKCMGNEYAISPNIDRLAEKGVLFQRAYTPCPVCMPARCSLISGHYPSVHGSIENDIPRFRHMPYLSDELKARGYTNIMVGKTHFWSVPDSFDIQIVSEGEKAKECDDFYGLHLKGHGFSRATKHPNLVPEDIFADAYFVDRTIEAIESVADKDEPFFAFCSLLSPHSPVDPPGKWSSIFDGVKLPKVNVSEGEHNSHPSMIKKLIGIGLEDSYNNGFAFEGNGLFYSEENKTIIDELRRRYYGLAAYCDYHIGRLIDYIDSKGMRENTLIIFASDHGQQYFDHGFNDKHNFYESSLQIPLIMSMPNTLPSGIKKDFASLTDITATIIAAAGGNSDNVQGFDLFNPLCRNEPLMRKCATSVLYRSVALVCNRYKLEYYFEDEVGRLFDLHTDPEERIDLFNDDNHREVRDYLLMALMTWKADLTDVNYLKENATGGGPVSDRVRDDVNELKGYGPDLRLSKKIEMMKHQ